MRENGKIFKSGFVALLGRPNVGKSTLLNRLVGEKVSIVSPKPQTTRNKIAGILTTDTYQIIFEDTPGLLKSTSRLTEFMAKSMESAGEADIIVVITDALKGLNSEDISLIEKYNTKDINLICVINKTDGAKPEQVLPVIKNLSDRGINEIYAISAKTGENVDAVLNRIVELLPEGVNFYPEDMITDKNERFMVAEIIREKILYKYREEIPHGIGVNINKFVYDEERQITDIDAEIFCEKDSHKAIIIGKNGRDLKAVGTSARHEIEKLLNGKVYLTLWVKVKEQWRDSEFLLNELGYNKKLI